MTDSIDIHLHFATKELLKQLKQCEDALLARTPGRVYRVTREEFVRRLNRVSPAKVYIPENLQQISTARHVDHPKCTKITGATLGTYLTPHGRITARVYEIYTGLRGQQRHGLVDEQGRVHHYDSTELFTTNFKRLGRR